MGSWQQEYLNHIAEIGSLRKVPEAADPQALEAAVRNRQDRIRALARENAELIRENLFPVLESVARADDETIADLLSFAGQLTGRGRPDSNLALHIHEALLAAARCRHDRDMLIRELYECGLWSYYFMDDGLAGDMSRKFRRKIGLYFREGASYLRIYDDISDTQTRGYIHRCMGNIAMSFSRDEPLQKLEAINASIRVLTDPVYRAKTPDLPWDKFVYASHQERTTLLYYLRNVEATPEVASQVMESAQIVRNAQEERVRKQGRPLEPRWQYVYAGALFFSGITDIHAYLDTMVGICDGASPEDYSPDGLYANASILAYMMSVLESYGTSVWEEYAPTVTRMLRRAVAYLGRAVRDPACGNVGGQAEKLLRGFLEFPGGMGFLELFHALAPLSDRDLYIHSAVCGKLCRWMAELALEEAPALLEGLPGGEDIPQWAEEAGLLHDVGLLLYPTGYVTPIRLRLQPEEELHRQHTVCGWRLLTRYGSVGRCAWAALGHHWPAYPEDYRREEDPTPILTDMTALSNYLSKCAGGYAPDLAPRASLEQLLARLEEDGDRFHPGLVSLVLAHRTELAEALEKILRQVYGDLWQTLCSAPAE